ncbi:MAG: rhamnulokinase family protein [Planctomycetota bacterium]|nr:rhamnulokinase family protein [Planctomycetota bacterium]
MMPNRKTYLAVDLGASSGRLVAGRFDGSKLSLHDVHRFENGAVSFNNRLQWNLPGLWQNIKDGMRKAKIEYGVSIESIGVDTWGVDFGFLGPHDELLGNPYHYRDSQTAGILPSVFEVVPREEIFRLTGLQFMELNTLYQLIAMRRAENPVLQMAESMLLIPDLFHWLMTGVKTNERTNASTTQFFDPRANAWAGELLEKFDIPTHFLQPITDPGTNIGRLLPRLQEETGLTATDVILPGTHDTASAVMAVPTSSTGSTDWCYISSGTWSLMGVETGLPMINERVGELNFTNEAGVGGTTRLLKNIAGLWLIQECRRIWQEEGRNLEWFHLVEAANESSPLVSLIEPDHPRFVAPRSMPEEIRTYCRETGQPVPETDGAIIRCALESLAMRYRMVLEWLEEIVGNRIETVHIVGGGTQNELLCQMAADACNRRIVTGPVEATAIGNLMQQLISRGDVASIAEARSIIAQSFDVNTYEPQQAAAWEEAYPRFRALTEQG